MNLEERIGQMFFVKYTENASQEISKKKFGGFVLYANFFNREDNLIQNDMKNIQNLSRKAVNLPLGLAVDEEGGFVNRVSLYKREEDIFPSSKDI
jgi:beta-glucosidase-like glycosyl hydrolase